MSYRLSIGRSGSVDAVTILTDNLVTALTGYDESDAVASAKSVIKQTLTRLRFPATAGTSTLVLAVLIPLQDLRPIEFAMSYNSSRILDKLAALLPLDNANGVELQGHWEEDTYVVREPTAENNRIERGKIAVSFDPPMWVPSQRERFQVSLTESLKKRITG